MAKLLKKSLRGKATPDLPSSSPPPSSHDADDEFHDASEVSKPFRYR